MLKKLSFKNEPKAKTHHWLCLIISARLDVAKNVSYKYCQNRDEVRAFKASLARGQRILVYRAHHNFVEGFIKE